MPKVSVVIPCYNQGQTLRETVDSVLQQTFSDYEIIIVNDGSDDKQTLELLSAVHYPQAVIIHTSNQGLASARNNGITIASGEYILPLDSDDLIHPEYLEKAVVLLDQNDDIGIVYSRAQLFGDVETEWLLPPYSLKEMLRDNVIFCSALFRRKDWGIVGGYDQEMVYGWEDYDFWLSLIELGRGVHRIEEKLFLYRVASDSMVRSKERWQKIAMFKRIYHRHARLIGDNIEHWIEELLEAREEYFTSRLYIDEGMGFTDSSSIARKIDKNSTRVEFQLPDDCRLISLRFDPIDAPAQIELQKISAYFANGAKKEVLLKKTNALQDDGNILFHATDDPQWFFDLREDEIQQIRRLVIDMRFIAIGPHALTNIIERLTAGNVMGRLKSELASIFGR